MTKPTYDLNDRINDRDLIAIDFGSGGDVERWIPNTFRIDCDYTVDNCDIHWNQLKEVPDACCNIMTATHVMHYHDADDFTNVLHEMARIVVPNGKLYIICYNTIWMNEADTEISHSPAGLLEIYRNACDDHHEWEIECFAMEYTDRPDPDIQEYMVRLNRIHPSWNSELESYLNYVSDMQDE